MDNIFNLKPLAWAILVHLSVKMVLSVTILMQIRQAAHIKDTRKEVFVIIAIRNKEGYIDKFTDRYRQLTDVVIVRSGSIIYDSHVERLARSLAKKYYVAVLGWNRQGLPKKEVSKYIVDIVLFDLKAPAGKPTLVLYFPLFWFWIFFRLCVLRPKIVHACDLDTFLPSYIYKVIFRRRLIFDIHDRYAMAYIPRKFKTIYSLVDSFEELCAKHSNALINVSETVLRTFRRRPKLCPIIMNCVEDKNIKKSKQEDHILKLAYTGPIIGNRGFDRITAAIKDLDDVELIIAGAVIEKQVLDRLLKLSNVKYIGQVQPKDALELEASSDAIIAIYDLDVPIYRIALPMKLLEAMMIGIPIITSTAAELINKVECGIIVEYDNVQQIKEAIIKLRDNLELRNELGSNGRKAFLQKYNWRVMEDELYKTYDDLLVR